MTPSQINQRARTVDSPSGPAPWLTALGVALALLLGLFLFASSASAAPIHPPLPALNIEGLNHACGTATDSKGDVYVSSAGESKVRVLDAEHNQLTFIENSNEPCGLAVDSKGNLYVSESKTGNVVKYAPDAYPLSGTPSYGAPVTIDSSGKAKGIAVDPTDDRLYVAEGDRISTYDSEGHSGESEAADEVQRILPGNATGTGGTYRLTFKGQTTEPIPYKANHAAVQAALEGLTTIGAGNVSVTEGNAFFEGRDHIVTFTGARAKANVPQITCDKSGLEGPFPFCDTTTTTKGFSGHIGEGALTNATGVGAYTHGSSPNATLYLFAADKATNEVSVFSAHSFKELEPAKTIAGPKAGEDFGFGSAGASVGVDPGSGHFFVYDNTHSAVDEFDASGEYLTRVSNPGFADAKPTAIAAYPRRNEVQHLLVQATGGTYKLEFEGQETEPLPYNATAAQVEAALKALSTIGEEDIAVVGGYAGAFASGTYSIAFAGGLGDRNVPQLGCDATALTGGFASCKVSTEAQGSGPGRLYVTAGAGSGAEVLAFGALPAPSRPPRPDLSFGLVNACGVAVDSHGDRYVAADTKIFVYPPTGNVPLAEIGDPGSPCHLAVDSSGHVYALDERNAASPKDQKAVYYTPDAFPPVTGTKYSPPVTVATPGTFPPVGEQRLFSIAINPKNDHVFVSQHDQTIEFDSAKNGSGVLNPAWGSGLGIARDDLAVYGANGNVYVSGGPTVFVVDPSGKEILTRISGAGSPKGPLNSGSSIAVDQSNGHVIVFSTERGVAEEYESSGAFLAEFGSFPALNRQAGVAVDNSGGPNDGSVYVAFFKDLSAFGPLAYGEPPIAVTGLASGVGGGDATLNGTVNPRGFDLEDCRFEYLTDAEYEHNVEAELAPFASATPEPCVESLAQIGHGTGPVAVHADITGVDPETTRYRFRLVAKNKYGESEGKAGPFGPPLLTPKPAQPVSYTEATLRARIDPSGLATKYRFEYGTGEEYGQSTPTAELQPAAGPTDVAVPIFGLAEGTEYHFRVVVGNEAKAVEGPDQTFETLERPESPPCPNEEFRTGRSAGLPDCRAYELVTPADTRGATPVAETAVDFQFNDWLVTPRGEEAGERLSFFTNVTLPGFDGNGRLDGYRAQRGAGAHPADGWRSELFSPSYAEAGGTIPNQGGVASDQLHSFWEVRPQETFEGTLDGTYLSTPAGFEQIGRGALGADLKAKSYFLTAGATHIVFGSKEHLEEAAPPKGTEAIYDRTLGGTTHVVSLLPGEVTPVGDSGYVGATEAGSTVLFSSGGRLYARLDNAETVGAPDALIGDTLACTGGPSGPTLAYQWLRNGAPIPAATNSSYTTVAADAGTLLQCQVGATNAEGGSLKTSVALAVSPFPSTAPPRPLGDPAITGTGKVGQTLTCDPGAWEADPAFSFQWYRNGAPISGETSSTHLLAGADKGTAVQCALTATNSGGAVLSFTARTFVSAQPPVASADPTISGTKALGQTLTCNPGTWTNSPAFSFEWLRNGTPIGGATAATYVVAAADEGKVLQCRVSAANADATAKAVSAGAVIPPAPGTAPPAQTSAGTVTGTATVGQTLTCSPGSWSASPTFTYQWLRNGAPIATATASTYTLQDADRQTTVQCQVTASNAGGTTLAINAGAGARYVDSNPPVASASLPKPGFTFAGVSEDGKRLFYTSAGNGANPGRLFVLDLETQVATPIATDSIFVNVSADGSRVYFTSEAALTGAGEENENGEHAETSKHNLYAWDGTDTRFIAILDPQDLVAFGGDSNMNLLHWTDAVGPRAGPLVGRASSPTRSTPDGGVFVFQSHARLTSYDNGGHGEIYRYDGEAPSGERLSCVSCAGAPPNTDARLQSTFGTGEISPVQASTLIPNVTDDGQAVFFQSSEQLLPEDANSVQDVYEWRAQGVTGCKRAGGCLALISSGQGENPNYLYSMSADGHDVFFTTLEKLVGADITGSPSIYDARVEGGIPDPPAKEPCQGDACQGQGSPPPALPVPASTGSGNGNVPKEGPSACRKPKHRVKGRCVKTHRKHRHHRRANHKRRAVR